MKGLKIMGVDEKAVETYPYYLQFCYLERFRQCGVQRVDLPISPRGLNTGIICSTPVYYVLLCSQMVFYGRQRLIRNGAWVELWP